MLGPLDLYAAAKSLQSCLTLCDPIDGSPPGSAVPGILQARTLEWVAISFSNPWQWKWSRSVVSHSSQPHGLQPTQLLRPWDFPGKSTGVGCHCLLHDLYDHLPKNCKWRWERRQRRQLKDLLVIAHSVQFSHSVMSDSLRPHESQHARPPCPSPTPRVHSDLRPSSQWCHPAISSSVLPFSSCPQFLPVSVFSNESTLCMIVH